MPIVRKQYSYVTEWKKLWEPDLEAIGTNNGLTTDPTSVDPKVLQWIKEHCVHTPHFVKIINPNAAHGRPGLSSRNASTMNVPGPFVKQHFRSLERVITLEQDNGRSWKVAFGSPKKYPTWNQGWDRFARDKNLKSGDVVVFVLVRHSCFHFTLFDAAGNISEKSTSTVNNDPTVYCKKEFPSRSSHYLPFISNPEAEQLPKTKKRLVANLLSVERLPNHKERDGAAVDTLPCQGQLETTPAKEQTAIATCKVRKLHNFGEEFRNGNISEKSTLTLNNDSTVFRKKEFPSYSSQDQPFVSNPQLSTTKKLFVMDLLCEQPNYKEHDGAATDTLPCHNHLVSPPAKEQIALRPRKENKQRKFREDFRAPSQILNLDTEVEIVRVESLLPRSTATPPCAPKRATDSTKSSQVSPVSSPRLESLPPLAFTFESQRRTVTPLERQRARELARECAGLIPGHCFMTVMSETHVYRDFHLVLPNWFGVALTLPAGPTRLKFLDGEGHSWDMFSKKNAMNQFALHRKYWTLFALHHLLEEGDVCVFAKKDESTIRTVIVHIFRVVPITMENVSSVHAHYKTHKMNTTAVK